MSSSQSAWEAAVFAGAAPRLETMLRNDPTLANVRLTAGQRALHMAARLSNDRVAALLINVPVTDVDAQDDAGNAPLHVAASVAADAIVRMLIKAGATVDVRNALGETPLFAAAMLGNEAAVTLLVEAGADENCMTVYGSSIRSVIDPAVAYVLDVGTRRYKYITKPQT